MTGRREVPGSQEGYGRKVGCWKTSDRWRPRCKTCCVHRLHHPNKHNQPLKQPPSTSKQPILTHKAITIILSFLSNNFNPAKQPPSPYQGTHHISHTSTIRLPNNHQHRHQLPSLPPLTNITTAPKQQLLPLEK